MSNDNQIIPFKPKVTSKVTPSDPQAAIVKMFERCLKAAKDGKIKFGAIAVVSTDGGAITTWEPADATSVEVTQALGAIAFLNHRFNASADDGGKYTEELIED